jgi:hypothetical protein
MSRKLLYIVLVLAMSVLFASLMVPRAGASPVLSVVPGTQTVAVGEAFTVNINLDYMDDLFAFDLTLTFDNTQLNATAVDYTGYLGTGGDVVIGPIIEINNTGGYVSAGVSRLVTPGVTGGGDLAVVHFNCTGPGTSTLHLVPYPITRLLNSSAKPVDHVTIDGQVKNNRPPQAMNLAITPSSPHKTDTLTANYPSPSTYYDADGDPEGGSEIRWYKNGVLQPALNDSETVSSSLIAKGQTWYFTVRPKDGMSFGTLSTSVSVTVLNSPPTAPGVDVTPHYPLPTDDLTCTVTAGSTDVDNDPVKYTYRWYRNGVLNKTTSLTTSLTDVLSHTLIKGGEVWNCTVTPNDGTADGTSAGYQVTVYATAAIAYNATNNIVTVTGGTPASALGFVDIWNADKAGTLTLQSRTSISHTDASPVAFTTNLRPTDYYVLGGTKHNLYITVSSWTSMTTSTIQISGTDTAGNVQTENIAVTGNGNYNATLYYHTCISSKVTVWTGTGSYAYTVVQAQWGVVWKTGTTQYAFDCFINIGNGATATYFTDTNKQVTLNDGVRATTVQSFLKVYDKATFTLGTLQDATLKRTNAGCSIFDMDSHTDDSRFGYLIHPATDAATCAVYLYGCQLESLAGNEQWWEALKAYNIVCNGYCYPYVATYTNTAQDYNNIIVSGTGYGFRRPKPTTTINNLFLAVTTNNVWFAGVGGTVSNVWARGSPLMARMQSTGADNTYLINVDTDTWAVLIDSASTGKMYRQYTFDLKATDNNGAPLSGTTVTLKDKNGNTVFSVSTAADGTITQQTVSRGYYDYAHGNTLQDYGPHTLTISKSGYMAYTHTFTLTGKTSWEISLNQLFLSGRSVSLDSPSTTSAYQVSTKEVFGAVVMVMAAFTITVASQKRKRIIKVEPAT